MTEPRWLLSDVPERIRRWILVDPITGCWRYLRGRPANRHGHRKVWWHDRKQWVHRVVFTELVGEIEPGLVLDHVKDWGCRWNDCCWPGHLEPVTQRENLRRAPTGVAARNAAKTHCPAKHALIPGNLVLSRWRRGQRICLTCDRDHDRARYPARKAQRARARAARLAGQVEAVRRLHDEGLSNVAIARRLRISRHSVADILAGRDTRRGQRGLSGP
jgi:hypothetical protein